jgi:hypothetical protein
MLINWRNYFSFLLILIISSDFSAQNILSKFKDKIDLNILSEVVKISDHNIFVKNVDISNVKNEDGLYYYFNSESGKKIFAKGFQVAYPFVGKAALVKDNKSWGIIDKSGNYIYQTDNSVKVKLSSFEKYVVFGDGYSQIYSLRDGEKKSGFINCAEPMTPDYSVIQNADKKFELITNESRKPIFKIKFDSIIKQNFLMYEGNDNLIILKKNNKYGLSLASGLEVRKIKYEKIKFIEKYIAILEDKNWSYYLYENNKLNFIFKSKYECVQPLYEENAIGYFKINGKYNILKTDGTILPEDFDYIDFQGSYGIIKNSIYIFKPNSEYYKYFDND